MQVMQKYNSFFFLICGLLFLGLRLQAQDVSIKLGATEIGSNQTFTIAVSVENDRLREYSDFPDIPGLRKGRPSSSSTTNIVNGKVTTSESITMNYIPEKEGTFRLPAFRMTINGKVVESAGATIKVGPAVQRKSYDPFADFWGFGKQQPQEFMDIKEEAFFAVSTNKREVYVGEGFTTTVAFYVSLNNRAKMDFYKVGEQLTDILKKIKPANCWEENFGIESINPEYVTLNGKQYRQYKIYEAAYYPLNNEDIIMPSVGLKMIKYKVAKNPSFFGRNTQEDFKTFYSGQKVVRVKDLPEHPLKDQVAVGNYRLSESPKKGELMTGQSMMYEFKIQGEGNISAINEPSTNQEKEDFVFYPPSIQQNITRANGAVYGSKSFNYYMEPQEPGTYQLGDYIEWVYFNTKTERYDTLRSEGQFVVNGESKKNSYIAATDFGGFYDRIEYAKNDLQSTTEGGWKTILLNAVILVLMGVTTYFTFKK